MSAPTPARTYNQNHVSRKLDFGGFPGRLVASR